MSDIETRVAGAMYDAWVLRSGSATKWDDLAQEERDNFADDARAAIAACSDHLITVAGNAADVEGTRSQRHYWAHFFAAELTKKDRT